MTSQFALDKTNAKILGVCAGLARSTGWDLMLVRLGTVASTLFLFGPLGVVAYVLAGLIAESR